MRPECRAVPCMLWMQLHLLLLHTLLIQTVGSVAVGLNKNSFATQQQHHAARRHAPLPEAPAKGQASASTLPSLLTTITQSNLIDSVLGKRLAKQQAPVTVAPVVVVKQQAAAAATSGAAATMTTTTTTTSNESYTSETAPPTQTQGPALESRSSNAAGADEHEDSVPLATVNNHSRNSQHVPKPPQYVDVSALVGRNMSGGSSMMASGGLSPYAALSGGSGGLASKSRSSLPECATQQVCNAIFVRMNYTQKLCECSSNYNWKCSHNLDPQDGHTIELTRKFDKRIYTQIKTCEPLREVRACKSPTDWTLLALQSERSGKAHYVVVCKCPTWAQLEGPYTHNHPPYANIPGIRVYGMLCVHQTARSSAQSYATYNPALSIYPEFPWSEALNVLNTTNFVPALQAS